MLAFDQIQKGVERGNYSHNAQHLSQELCVTKIFFLFQIYLNIFFKNSKPTLFHIIFIFRDRFIFLTETNKQENIWEKEFLQRIRDYYTKLLIIVYNVYIAHNVYNCLYMFKKIICYVFFFSTFNVILRIRNQF